MPVDLLDSDEDDDVDEPSDAYACIDNGYSFLTDRLSLVMMMHLWSTPV